MARRFNTHNRFADELDSNPSRFDELTFHNRVEGRAQRVPGWRRNLAYVALAIAAVLIATFVAR